MIRILITPCSFETYTCRPLSPQWNKRFAAHMKEMGQLESAETFFQSVEDLPETIQQNRRAMRDLSRGWSSTILVDPREYGHWLGWDAHTVAE